MSATPEELVRLIEWAKARGPMTKEEIRAQRVSWAYGQMMDCAPHMTKEQVAQIHDEMYGHDA